MWSERQREPLGVAVLEQVGDDKVMNPSAIEPLRRSKAFDASRKSLVDASATTDSTGFGLHPFPTSSRYP